MKKASPRSKHQAGFTLIEGLIVFALILVFAAMAIPGYQALTRFIRISGDARNLNGVIAQAKMRAAADFSHARAYADLRANTYHLEIWNPTGGPAGKGCWQTDGDNIAVNPCTAANSPAQPLSQGVTFGFGNAAAGAPNPQAVIAQASFCGQNASVTGLVNPPIPNTACVEFNSRGIPIDLTGKSTALDAIYVTDGNSVYGITLLASGMMQDWSTPASTTSWHAR